MKKGMSDGKRTFLYGILFGCVYSTHMGIKMLLEGISSVSLRLTAPSAEGAFWCVPPRKASPERGGARPRRAEGFRSPRRDLPTRGNESISISYRVHEKVANGLRPLAAFNMPSPNSHVRGGSVSRRELT